MEPSLTVLKLTLDALEVDASIKTLDDRKRVQKAIYLAQAQGLDLGYRYGWYLMGPYCPSLTQDYFKLHNELVFDETAQSSATLRGDVLARLKALTPLLRGDARFPKTQESWLELLASVHFLRKLSGKSDVEARDFLDRKKPDISSYYQLAISALKRFHLLS